MSVLPPGDDGTISRIALAGYDCASLDDPAAAINAAATRRIVLIVFLRSFRIVRFALSIAHHWR
jgi:hypothetical protein